MNRKSKKYSQKTVGILYDFLRVVVSVLVCECAYACVGYNCVLMSLNMGEVTNAARCFSLDVNS